MTRSTALLRSLPFFVCVLVLAGCAEGPAQEAAPQERLEMESIQLRVALFNVKELRQEKLTGPDAQLSAVVEIVQSYQPDVLVINEIDAFPEDPGLVARELASLLANTGDEPIEYPHVFSAPTNTGELAGMDFDNDGTVTTDAGRGTREHGGDSFGYGTYPGEYGMALLSRYEIDSEAVRTFQRFLWRDLPNNHLPEDWYSEEEQAIFRLSSKSHWDVPVKVEGKTLHLLMSHPTPPVFDGDEDRNGRRNFDEIAFWAYYLNGDTSLYDDQGATTAFDRKAAFVIVGDLNAAPVNEPVYDQRTAIDQLLSHPRVQDSGPSLTSVGALAGRQPGPPEYFEQATAGFAGGRRIDYLLPSKGIEIVDGGVYWPEDSQLADAASDHRFLWLDIEF